MKEREAISMEKNAREVAKQVTAMVNDELGPAKDYLKCNTTTTSNRPFYSCGLIYVPGYHYLKKM